ncbi:hypothetical protein CCMA1212_004463 [Trichoderma ghanense]|uniref:Uncharacterized protein n=1 Tax=Trichoderma ghanense TaxID=65468 RepID=A0ABY2H5I4_9HYPO
MGDVEGRLSMKKKKRQKIAVGDEKRRGEEVQGKTKNEIKKETREARIISAEESHRHVKPFWQAIDDPPDPRSAKAGLSLSREGLAASQSARSIDTMSSYASSPSLRSCSSS